MFTVSTYFSMQYLLILLPITVVLYCVTPQKIRRLIILLSSYIFFRAVSGKLIAYLLFSTLSIHHIGIWLSSIQGESDHLLELAQKQERKAIKAQSVKKQKQVLFFAVALHIGILLILKYTPFFATNINSLLHIFHSERSIHIPSYAMPIGISFYTMQAVSYIFDVYRRKIHADQNLLRLALFMGFFPQIMEGPICRYSDTAEQLWNAEPVSYHNLTYGMQRILFGMMKKIVVADRLNILIKHVFNNYGKYDGFVIALVTVCYTIQLYMDFSGTMDLVLGSGQLFGVKVPENFQRPFFSKTISEFWKRWHITLGTWFRDYIFYPVSMSKPLKKLTSKARKKIGNHFGPLLSGSIALFCVWFCNGLWHGAGWHYIFFGMYHFVLIVSGNMIEPLVIKVTGKLHIRRNHSVYRWMQIVRTSILVCIGELFFRADGLKNGFFMFKKIFTDFTFDTCFNSQIFTYGMDKYDFLIVFIALVVVFVVGYKQEKGIAIRKKIATRNVALRFAVWYALILFTVVFGAYGVGYIPVDPMYAGF